ncbi:uncharacterized protein LOC120679697 [Panicum virgatum]|uniref:Uncharacterized protein n=1 Tax=Panicum virgatum TaxID=38727 RepID=A0A8T0QVL4_PANVG|nr:uncharacterized protein LOC120679697 [Panicum virgatum]KAG2577039.1 hypothetical protein PVAP13_6NG077300 [Panicum virgatum]
MAKLAAQLKDKFFGLVGRITGCGRAHKDAAAGVIEPKSLASQHVEIRSRGGPPHVDGGARGHINDDGAI